MDADITKENAALNVKNADISFHVEFVMMNLSTIISKLIKIKKGVMFINLIGIR